MRLLINLGLLLCSLFWLNFAIAITPADRVITLSPSATEMAYAAGMGIILSELVLTPIIQRMPKVSNKLPIGRVLISNAFYY